MSWLKSCCSTLILVALGSAFDTAAQPAVPASASRLIPVLRVFAMPGFQVRAPSDDAAGEIPLDIETAWLSAVTLQSDVRGPCTNQLQMPGAAPGSFDTTASAEWRVQATPVSNDGEEATVDVRWERRVPRPGLLLEEGLVQQRRLVLRDRARGILDVVRRAGRAAGVCDSFAIGVELRFRSFEDDVDDAGLGFDCWLINRGAPASVGARVRTQARQGEDATYVFPPLKLNGAAGEVTMHVSGTVTGRARKDRTINLTFDTWQGVLDKSGGRGSGGRKRLVVRPGETIEFQLPEPLKAKLPADLQQHDFALRVTTERLW